MWRLGYDPGQGISPHTAWATLQCLCHRREVHQPHRGLVHEGSSHWADDITQNQNLISMLSSTGIVSTGAAAEPQQGLERWETHKGFF